MLFSRVPPTSVSRTLSSACGRPQMTRRNHKTSDGHIPMMGRRTHPDDAGREPDREELPRAANPFRLPHPTCAWPDGPTLRQSIPPIPPGVHGPMGPIEMNLAPIRHCHQRQDRIDRIGAPKMGVVIQVAASPELHQQTLPESRLQPTQGGEDDLEKIRSMEIQQMSRRLKILLARQQCVQKILFLELELRVLEGRRRPRKTNFQTVLRLPPQTMSGEVDGGLF